MPIPKARKILSGAAVGALTFLLAIMCVVLAYTGILYRQSLNLLNTVQAIKVGGVLDSHTIEVAKQMKAIAYVGTDQHNDRYEYFYVDPSARADSRYATEFVPVSFDRCMNDFCVITFPASKIQVDRVFEFLNQYPKTLLRFFNWIYSQQRLHHWLPIAWLDPVTITVKKGVVEELDIRMRSVAVNAQICPGAETHITSALSDTPSWEVVPIRAAHTGGDCNGYHGIRVNATTGASREQLAHALDFNLHCLLPGGYCTECDMLLLICRNYLGRNVLGSEVNVPLTFNQLGAPRIVRIRTRQSV